MRYSFVELSEQCCDFIISTISCNNAYYPLSSTLPVFQESATSLQKYYVLLRVNSNLMLDTSCLSTIIFSFQNNTNEKLTALFDDSHLFANGMNSLTLGHKVCRKKVLNDTI